MRPVMSDQDESVLQRLPLPLAQLYRRARNAPSPLERHQAFWYCWETAIKLLGASVVLEFAERRGITVQHRERLQSLARPSLGHWWGYCHTFIPLLAEHAQDPFHELDRGLLGPARRDLPQTAVLDASLRRLFQGDRVAVGPVRLRDLFDRLVRYRNEEIGHGSLGMRAGEFYETMAGRLQEAFLELFGPLDVLAGRRLIYVRKVNREPSGEWSVDRLELLGEVVKVQEPLRLPPGAAASLPVPQRLYLQGMDGAAGGMPPLRSLHPLVVYHEHDHRVYFLNARQGSRDVEYLDHLQGGRLSRDELADAHRAFLAGVLAAPVDAAAVDHWAEASRTEAEIREVSPARSEDGADRQGAADGPASSITGLRQAAAGTTPRLPPPRANWRRVVLVTATCLMIIAFLLWRIATPLFTAAPHTPGTDKEPGPDPILPPLQGDLDITVTEMGNPLRQKLMLHQPGALPLRPGDWFEYTASVTPRKAYLYVIYLNSDGSVTPLFPWKPHDWTHRPKEVARTRWSDRGYMEAGLSGIEALLLLTRETPLPISEDLRKVIGELPRQQVLPYPLARAWFENGELDLDSGVRAAPKMWRDNANDPIPRTQALLRDRLGKLFPYTRAVCFAFQGNDNKRNDK